MSLNESIVEDAALTWFGELGYVVGHGPQFAPVNWCASGGVVFTAIHKFMPKVAARWRH